MTEKPRVEPSVSEPARQFKSLVVCAECVNVSDEIRKRREIVVCDLCHFSQEVYGTLTLFGVAQVLADPKRRPVIAPQPTSGQRCQNCDATYVNTNFAHCPACGSAMAYAIERNQQ